MKQFLTLALTVFSILGIFDAAYLTYEKLNGALPPCGGSFDCGTVLNSSFSMIGPLPLSVFGMGYYATVLLLSSVIFMSDQELVWHVPNSNLKLTPTLALTGLTSFGFAFSILLVGVMAFVLEAWCLFCLLSAGISTILFLSCFALYEITAKARKNT